jgi:hypothetical protein
MAGGPSAHGLFQSVLAAAGEDEAGRLEEERLASPRGGLGVDEEDADRLGFKKGQGFFQGRRGDDIPDQVSVLEQKLSLFGFGVVNEDFAHDSFSLNEKIKP